MDAFKRGTGGPRRDPMEAPSDARRAVDHPRLEELDPEVGRRVRVRRRLFKLGLAAVFLVGLVHAVLGDDGMADRHRLARERQRLVAEVEERNRRVEALADAIRGLEGDPMSRERIAREQLGYARPGEVVFLLPDTDDELPDPGNAH